MNNFCCKSPFKNQMTARLKCQHARRDKKPRKGPMKEPYKCEICSTGNIEVWHLKCIKERWGK